MNNYKPKPSQRTLTQNKALHKLFQLWADALNDAEKDMFTVLKDYVDIPWADNTVKQYLWLPLLSDNDVADAHEKLTEKLEPYIEVDLLPSIEEIMQVTLKKGLKIYCEMIAKALNDAGQDMRGVLKTNTQVWWDKDSVKEFLWRPVQVLQLQKKSTTQLSTREIDEVYDTVNRHLGKHIDTIMFPSIEDIINERTYEKQR